ncbi:hypothetical protein [Virgisporangium aurantiacum]|uniref:Secreted protein n=1 Tax=Virgisporangium aurantiacum TaxID=175570 RepID=A0A8J3Z3Z9_9ACTN|nr:hypothetical protein [Virgisporangium aurantiacum]GIJ55972.1 hypothetical protein Vau01_034880 [Virgisporangium aurantiacum]
MVRVRAPRLLIAGGAAAALLAAGIGIAAASDKPAANKPAAANVQAAGTISCPTVADKLPAIPAAAAAEVQQNLDLLDKQIAEANNRLATSVGQGGPAFVQNAILGPLADKRRATIDRIAIAIGRHAARPTGLDSLATCTLGAGGGVQQPPANGGAQPPANGGNQPPATQPATQPPAAAGTISCPTVADKLPAIPAAAKAEVDRNLELLNKQIAEANTRLANSVGQGGPAFVQNAILGPLADKRRSTIDRIAIAIGRHTAKPTGLDSLATCTVA